MRPTRAADREKFSYADSPLGRKSAEIPQASDAAGAEMEDQETVKRGVTNIKIS